MAWWQQLGLSEASGDSPGLPPSATPGSSQVQREKQPGVSPLWPHAPGGWVDTISIKESGSLTCHCQRSSSTQTDGEKGRAFPRFSGLSGTRNTYPLVPGLLLATDSFLTVPVSNLTICRTWWFGKAFVLNQCSSKHKWLPFKGLVSGPQEWGSGQAGRDGHLKLCSQPGFVPRPLGPLECDLCQAWRQGGRLWYLVSACHWPWPSFLKKGRGQGQPSSTRDMKGQP